MEIKSKENNKTLGFEMLYPPKKQHFLLILLLIVHGSLSVGGNAIKNGVLHYEIQQPNNSDAKSSHPNWVLEEKNDNVPFVSPPGDMIVSSCKAFIEKYSDVASNFTSCSIKYSRPVRFCEYCVADYMSAKNIYAVIMKGKVKDRNKKPCSTWIFNSDRLQVIVQTSQFIENIWKDGNCINCFNMFEKINNTEEVYQIANDTQQFYALANQTWNCFTKYSKDGMSPFPAENSTGNISVCSKCHNYYQVTNIFYDHLEDKYANLVCMDVVDSMNYTRILWSKTYQCSRPKEDVVGVLILSGLFCSIPIIFYVTSKVYGSRMEHKILEQKRLNKSQSTSRIDERAGTSRQIEDQ